MYEMIGSGQVASVRVGRLRRIAAEAFSTYVAHARLRRALRLSD